VPGLVRLIDDRPVSGRYRVDDLLVGARELAETAP
jgi:hypothetical protein